MHEEHAGEGGDRRRGVAEQRAEGDADHAGHGHVQGGTDDRPQRTGSGDGHAQVVAAQQRLAEEERDEAGDQRGREDVPAKTASLPHSTGRRRGTAVSDERIMPVLYSPLIISTPSTPNATTAKMVPRQAGADGVEWPGSRRRLWYWLAVTAENSAPMPIISTTAVEQGVHGGPQGPELRQLRAQHPALGHLQRGLPGAGAVGAAVVDMALIGATAVSVASWER